MLLRGGVDAAGRIALPIGKMVGRTGLGPPKNAPAGRSRRCGPHRPTGWKNGRADRLGPPKNAPAGGVGAAGRIALPVGKMVGRTGLGPPKNPLREKSALRAASPYLCEAFQHSMKPDAKSSGWF
jgi:hypothetical protein